MKELCNNCKHYQGLGTCAAYPHEIGLEIPDEIFYGDNMHDKIQPDQFGDFIFDEIKDSTIPDIE